MDPIKVDFQKKGVSKKDIIIPPEKAGLKTVICIIGTLLVAAIAYYIMLPPLNFKAMEFYLYIGLVFVSYIILTALTCGLMNKPEYSPYVRRKSTIPGILIVVLLVVVAIGYAVSSVVLRAKAYSEIMPVITETKFAEDVEMLDADTLKSVPRLDAVTAQMLSRKALSSLADQNLISQYEVSDMSTQFNYDDHPVRAMPLQYANLIKWFTNRNTGLPGYVIVDMTTMSKPSYEYVEAPGGGIKYSPYEHFGRLLKRHLRFAYPTYMFAEPTFEMDDNGKPYWVCARLNKTIGLFGGTDVLGVVLVEADSPAGAHSYYPIEDIKTDAKFQWLDRIYSSTLLVEQYDYYGKYRSGFWNSVLGQKDVRVTTADHNYLALNDDVYLYTGVTSVTSDEGVIGFVLINQRTKEAKFYRVDGAKEDVAQRVAEGLVKDLGYNATFPLLINIGGEPTYFMALKDDSENIQQYSMINVSQFNTIKIHASSFAECVKSYIENMRANGISVQDINFDGDTILPPSVEPPKTEKVTAEGVLTDIRSAVVNGTTQYYFQIDSKAAYYTITAGVSETAILAKPGDRVRFTYPDTETGSVIAIDKMELLPAAETNE